MKKCGYIDENIFAELLNEIYARILYHKALGNKMGLCNIAIDMADLVGYKNCMYINDRDALYNNTIKYFNTCRGDNCSEYYQYWWHGSPKNTTTPEEWYKPRIAFIRDVAKVNNIKLKVT